MEGLSESYPSPRAGMAGPFPGPFLIVSKVVFESISESSSACGDSPLERHITPWERTASIRVADRSGPSYDDSCTNHRQSPSAVAGDAEPAWFSCSTETGSASATAAAAASVDFIG